MTIAPRRARRAAYVGLVACVTAFGAGLVAWASDAATRDETLLWRLGGSFTLEQVQSAAATLGIPYAVLTASVMLLDIVWLAVGVCAAALVLRGASSWFRIYLAIVLAVWSTTGGALVAIYESNFGGVPAAVVGILFGLGWFGAI